MRHCADALANRASQIITSRRKRSWCGSSADHRHRYSGRLSARLYRRPARSRNTGMRYSTSIPCNIRPDNNRRRTLRTDSLHIRPEKLPRGLRKGSIATLECDAWISSSFSSDIPLCSFPFSITEPFTRLCLACCSLVNRRCSDFHVRFESDASIGRRPGEISGTLLDCGDISTSSKAFCINSGVRYRQPPNETKFLLARCVPDDCVHHVRKAAVPIDTPREILT